MPSQLRRRRSCPSSLRPGSLRAEDQPIVEALRAAVEVATSVLEQGSARQLCSEAAMWPCSQVALRT